MTKNATVIPSQSFPFACLIFIQLVLLFNQSSNLVDVALLVHALGRLLGFLRRVVLAELGIRVGLGTLEEGLLACLDVLGLALPRLKGGVLEGASVGEGHVPRVGGLVHGVEVKGGLHLGLAAGKEHDTGDGGGNTAAEHLEGVISDLVRGGLVLVLGTRGDHGRLEEDTLEKHLVVSEVLEGLGPNILRDFESTINAVVTVHQNLGLDNRN
mmetsp:Transcript_16835/g.30520  ORF Transcript_16835/g.30520 Transcript_16835/m.30520 type:complete len:212 (-) Transcript_16835:126-761(-)